jgi:D-methionine transport system permease protein
MPEAFFPNVRLDQLLLAASDTLYMTAIAGAATFFLGLILGALLFLTGPAQLLANRYVYGALSVFSNTFRSIPFIILIVLLIPLTKLIVGRILGVNAALPALIIGAAHFMRGWWRSPSGRSIRASSKRRARWAAASPRSSSKF